MLPYMVVKIPRHEADDDISPSAISPEKQALQEV